MIVVFLSIITIFGLYTLSYERMKDVYAYIIERLREYGDSFKGTDRTQKDELWVHLRTLMNITLGLGTDKGVRMLIFVSCFMGTCTLLVLVRQVSPLLTMISTIFSMMLPYMILRLKLTNLRVSGSREGLILLNELTDNYRIYFFNMRMAIEKTVASIEDAPRSKKLLTALLAGLNRNQNEQNTVKLLREFGMSINTSWSDTLEHLMYFSIFYGVKVDEALGDLVDTVRQAEEISEYSRRENNEAILMTRFLAPGCYILTIWGGIKFFGLTFSQIIYYQFETGAGLTWLTISSILFAASAMANSFFSRSKLDL